MNYPTTLQNPLLKRRETKEEKEERERQVRFNNLDRPISGYKHTDHFKRPFSTKEGGETLMHKRKELQMKTLKENPSAANLSEAEKHDLFMKQYNEKLYDRGLPHIESTGRLSSATTFQLGRSIQSSYKRAP